MDHKTLVQKWSAWGPIKFFFLVSNTAPLCSTRALHSSPLMMMPRSTPLRVGSLTWKVPLLGTTDSVKDWDGREMTICCKTWRFLSRLNRLSTCNIELHLHRHLVGQSRVPQQLMGLLQGAVLSRDPVDGQQSVADLQQPTPTQGAAQMELPSRKHTAASGLKVKPFFNARPVPCN